MQEELKTQELINVYLRLRHNIKEDENTEYDLKNNTIFSKDNSYTFTKVFTNESTQENIFKDVGKKHVDSVLGGVNSTIFAYGQTGTGKTFTIEGSENLDGLIQNSTKYLFDYLNFYGKEIDASLTFLEVYNENIYDLLEKNKEKNVQIAETNEGQKFLNVKTEKIENYNQFKNLFEEGKKRRTTRNTNMNERSSRSHSILTIKIEFKCFENRISNLNFVDLAGSESLKLPNKDIIENEEKEEKLEYFQNKIPKFEKKQEIKESDKIKETGNINKSLLCLRELIKKLGNNQNEKIVYRSSKLTMLLKESMTKNSRISLIGCVNLKYSSESLNTMVFLQRAKFMKMREEHKIIDSFSINLKDEIKEYFAENNLEDKIESNKLSEFINSKVNRKLKTVQQKTGEQILKLFEENRKLKSNFMEKSLKITNSETTKDVLKKMNELELEIKTLKASIEEFQNKIWENYDDFIENEKNKIYAKNLEKIKINLEEKENDF